MPFQVKQFRLGELANCTYLFWDDSMMVGGIVDPGHGAETALEEAEKMGIRVELILVSHNHPDHVSSLQAVKTKADAWVSAHESSSIEKELPVSDGQGILLGNGVIEVIHTPGHTSDSVCFLVDAHLFTGDTLFVGECGRTDLPTGSSKELHHSLFEVLAQLPDETIVWPGHDYGKKLSSTIGEEKAESYIFNPARTVEEFEAFMLEE